jgi:Xaa-Pro aminopeptidase
LPAVAFAQIANDEYAARRAALASRLEDGVFVLRGAPEPERDYESFSQLPDFLYLTGYREPGAALVMHKQGTAVRWTLFVEARDPAQEVWSGRRFGTDGATRATGIPARDISALTPTVDSLLATSKRLYVTVPVGADVPVTSNEQRYVQELVKSRPQTDVRPVGDVIAEMRGKKSPAELELLRKSIEITVQAQREAARALEPGMNEFELQALIEYTFRRNGSDRPSFATIVGSGPNSTTLHYNADDRFMNPGEVVVMDVGSSYRGYAADVTRTYPVNGTFSPEQREIYQLVRNAQAAAERQAKVGARARLMDDSSRAVLAAGLTRLGLIESASATYDCGSEGGTRSCPQLTLFYMHGLGHGIGLEVHDPDQFYFTGTIGVGSAFSIEPGIYVRENLLEILPNTPKNQALVAKIGPAVRKYANIGVRIEDDYLVTDKGVEWVSRAPREIDEIEALMKQPFTGPVARDSTRVDWYRKVTPKP